MSIVRERNLQPAVPGNFRVGDTVFIGAIYPKQIAVVTEVRANTIVVSEDKVFKNHSFLHDVTFGYVFEASRPEKTSEVLFKMTPYNLAAQQNLDDRCRALLTFKHSTAFYFVSTPRLWEIAREINGELTPWQVLKAAFRNWIDAVLGRGR